MATTPTHPSAPSAVDVDEVAHRTFMLAIEYLGTTTDLVRARAGDADTVNDRLERARSCVSARLATRDIGDGYVLGGVTAAATVAGEPITEDVTDDGTYAAADITLTAGWYDPTDTSRWLHHALPLSAPAKVYVLCGR